VTQDGRALTPAESVTNREGCMDRSRAPTSQQRCFHSLLDAASHPTCFQLNPAKDSEANQCSAYASTIPKVSEKLKFLKLVKIILREISLYFECELKSSCFLPQCSKKMIYKKKKLSVLDEILLFVIKCEYISII